MTLSTEALSPGYPSRAALTVRGERGPQLKKVVIGGTPGRVGLLRFWASPRIAS